MTILLSGYRIDGEKSTIGDCSYFTVTAGELKFDIPDRALALEQRHFTRPYFRFHEIAGARAPQIFKRLDGAGVRPQHRVVLEQVRQRLGIGQIAETLLFSEFGRGFGPAHINASANGMSVALMEG